MEWRWLLGWVVRRDERECGVKEESKREKKKEGGMVVQESILASLFQGTQINIWQRSDMG